MSQFQDNVERIKSEFQYLAEDRLSKQPASNTPIETVQRNIVRNTLPRNK